MGPIQFARHILDMQKLIEWQGKELDRLRKVETEYNKLLKSSLEHSKQMAGNMLKTLLTPGVSEALIKSNEE
jgi:hypothetical protein